MKKRVCIAMSGGVDSSVVAALLKQDGYDCIGLHLHFWTDPVTPALAAALPQNKCCSLGGLEDARAVCQAIDIPFYVLNVEEHFRRDVVEYFLKGYADGQTPNPCIECNRRIKFGLLLDRARELGADFLATGHYARVAANSAGRAELWMAEDKAKDQSYFLYRLTSEKLARIIFPLGSLRKAETYEAARRFALPRVTEKPESQGLCFFAEGSPKYFLERYLPREKFSPGPIVTRAGDQVGVHKGLSLYTIGQRRGLGIGGLRAYPEEGEAWYVIEIDRAANRLVVGRKEETLRRAFVCSDAHFISGEPPNSSEDVLVRIRHRGRLVPSRLIFHPEGGLRVESEEGYEGLSPGQSAVFYAGERVLGGGIIEKSYAKKSEAHAGEKRTCVPASH